MKKFLHSTQRHNGLDQRRFVIRQRSNLSSSRLADLPVGFGSILATTQLTCEMIQQNRVANLSAKGWSRYKATSFLRSHKYECCFAHPKSSRVVFGSSLECIARSVQLLAIKRLRLNFRRNCSAYLDCLNKLVTLPVIKLNLVARRFIIKGHP